MALSDGTRHCTVAKVLLSELSQPVLLMVTCTFEPIARSNEFSPLTVHAPAAVTFTGLATEASSTHTLSEAG
jgi:hypothetical protein